MAFATVHETIGAAIADVIVTFPTVTIAAAECGKTWAEVAQHAEKGRALVYLGGAVPVDGDYYADSARMEYQFAVRFEVPCRGTKPAAHAALMKDLASKFNPNSTTLQTAVAALSSDPQPIRATVVPSWEVEGRDDGDGPDFLKVLVMIRAQTYVSV